MGWLSRENACLARLRTQVPLTSTHGKAQYGGTHLGPPALRSQTHELIGQTAGQSVSLRLSKWAVSKSKVGTDEGRQLILILPRGLRADMSWTRVRIDTAHRDRETDRRMDRWMDRQCVYFGSGAGETAAWLRAPAALPKDPGSQNPHSS